MLGAFSNSAVGKLFSFKIHLFCNSYRFHFNFVKIISFFFFF